MSSVETPRVKLARQTLGLAALLSASLLAVSSPHWARMRFSGWPGMIDYSPGWQGPLDGWLLAVGALLVLRALHAKLDGWMSRHPRAAAVALALVCGFGAMASLWPNLEARFYFVDDHQIVRAIGPGQRCHWRDWPQRFLATEAGHPGATTRYRPGYYGLLLAESCKWGKNVRAWYEVRIALAALTLWLLWLIARPWLGGMLAFGLSAGAFSVPGMSDVFCRLGPAEIYALPTFLLGVWGVAGLWLGQAGFLRVWLPIVAGFGIAAMCKENFILLGGLAWIVAAVGLWQQPAKRSRVLAWTMLALLGILLLALLVCVVLGTRSGSDVYGHSLGGTSLVASALRAGGLLIWGRPLVVLWVALGAWIIWRRKQGLPAPSLPSSRLNLWLLLAVTALAWLSQAIFYRAAWLQGSRYDLPGVLLPLVIIAVVLAWVGRNLERSPSPLEQRAARWIAPALVAALLLAAGAGAVRVHRAAEINRRKTRYFASWVKTLAAEAKAHPETALVFVPDDLPLHYGAFVALNTFLESGGTTNPMRFSLDYLNPKPSDPALAQSIAHTLQEKPPIPLFTKGSRESALFIPLGIAAQQRLRAAGLPVSPVSLEEAVTLR